MSNFIKKHQAIIIKSIKLWAPFSAVVIALYLFSLYGPWGIVIGFITIGVISTLIFLYVDFKKNKKDDVFRVIYDNLNRIENIFKNVEYTQFNFMIDDEVKSNIYSTYKDDAIIEYTFTIKKDKRTFVYYGIKDDCNMGTALSTDIDYTGETTYIVPKNYQPNTKLLRNENIRIVNESKYYNIYSNNLSIMSEAHKNGFDILFLYITDKNHFISIKDKKMLLYLNSNDFLSKIEKDKSCDINHKDLDIVNEKILLDELTAVNKQIDVISNIVFS